MITRKLGVALLLAAALLGAAAALRYAANIGMIDAETARRAVQVIIGLGLAGYGNLMPKQLGRPRSTPHAEARAQAALRVGGWSMTLAGLVHAGLWAFAPLAFADTAAMVAVGAAVLVTFAYAVRCFTARGGPQAA